MRIRSRLFVAFISASAMAALIACVSDAPSGAGTETNDGGTTGDASLGDSGPSNDAGPAAPTANANDIAVYVGQIAALDASASTPPGATFSWAVTSVPAGSAIVIASLQNATTAKPSFTPDVAGDYKLTVTVASSGATANKVVTVHAHAGKAFFGYVKSFPDGGALSQVRYANTDGTGAATISCDTAFISTAGGGSIPYGRGIAAEAVDWREGAPADNPTVAFGFRDSVSDGGFTNYVAVGNASSTCATLVHADPQINVGDFPRGVRISPNGDRIAYVRNDGTTLSVATIGIDGTNMRILGLLYPTPSDGGTNVPPASIYYRRLQWADETHVDWIAEGADHVSFSIYSATDSASPGAGSIMDCAAVEDSLGTTEAIVEQFALVSDGFLVSGNISTVDAGQTGLIVLRPNVSTKQCELVRTIGNGASDFSLSPDGTTLAFVMGNDAGTPVIYMAAANGGAGPTLLPFGDAGLMGETDFGPRWVAGGSSLVLSDPEVLIDGGSSTNVVSISTAGGTRVVVAASSDSTEGFYSPGNFWECSMARAGIAEATPIVSFGAFGIFLGLVVRRRKRNVK